MTKKKNSNLRKAAKVKNDEFYTRLTDIENELSHYRDHFKNKIVYCNCDDQLDGGWGDVIADIYEKYNSIDTTMTFSTEESYLVDDYLTPSNKENIKTFTIVNPVLEILIKDEYVQRSFSSNKAGDLTIGIVTSYS